MLEVGPFVDYTDGDRDPIREAELVAKLSQAAPALRAQVILAMLPLCRYRALVFVKQVDLDQNTLEQIFVFGLTQNSVHIQSYWEHFTPVLGEARVMELVQANGGGNGVDHGLILHWGLKYLRDRKHRAALKDLIEHGKAKGDGPAEA